VVRPERWRRACRGHLAANRGFARQFGIYANL
jgi:hypothetical protein